MTTENTAVIEEQDEQINVVADIFANLLQDAETIIERQRRILQQQMDDVTRDMGSMIKDAMLNICASAGIQYDTIKPVIARKKFLLDANGHTDETDGGSTD